MSAQAVEEMAPVVPLRRKRSKGLPQEELHERYPSLEHLAGPNGTQKAWAAVFNARPDAMHALLADYFKHVHATPGRIGQRPMPREEQVDYEALLYGEENDLLLVDVLPKLVKVSERSFCSRIAMSRSQYQRLLRGQYQPTIHELRMIARAVKKPPVYFVEYRQAMVADAFADLIQRRPGIATSLFRTYLEIRA